MLSLLIQYEKKTAYYFKEYSIYFCLQLHYLIEYIKSISFKKTLRIIVGRENCQIYVYITYL